MDLGDGSLRSGTDVEENLGKEASFDEIELGIDGSSSVNEIGDLGSVKQSVKIENLEKSVDGSEIEIGINGCSSVSEIGDLGSVDQGIKIEALEKSTDPDETEIGTNGSPSIGEIGDLGSLKHGKVGTLEKALRCDEIKVENNGSHVDEILKIDKSLEMNGDGTEREKVVGLTLKGIGSPSEKGSETAERTACFDEIKLESSGSPIDEVGVSAGGGGQHRVETPTKTNVKGVEIEKAVETPSIAIGSLSGGSSGTPVLKGYGLKKWRRIRRDPGKDGISGGDPSRILKRGLSNTDPAKARDSSVDHKQKSEGAGSVSSVNSAMKNMVFSALPIGGLDSEFRLAFGSTFPIGTDSENSEDRSSKSTAGSAPKLKLELPTTIGSTKERSKVKNPSGRGSGGAAHWAQQGKGKVETSKKLRGERVRAEKENSYSSVESDLRSSSAAFMLVGGFAGVGDGRQRERSLNYSGENSDEVQVSEPQSSEEVQVDYYKENGEEVEVVSREDMAADVLGEEKKQESENGRLHVDQDPLIESIVLLQTVQEALEKEIKEFGEIGKGSISLNNGSSHAGGLSHHVLFEEMEESDSPPFESQVSKLTQNVNLLQHKLEEMSAALKVKELEVLMLESVRNKTQLPGHKTDSNLLQEQEVELEDLFKKRIEAEVEYLMMTRTTQKLKVTAEDQISLSQSLAKEQDKMLLKLREAENKASILKGQAEELEASYKELLGTKEVLKTKNNVCKYSLCLFIQLVMLCIVFGLFLMQLLPNSTEYVPT
ncbi:WPP domain-interacting protein 1 [Magnolia sinica]|uniref:WPP domain-interacting protein 1 n=1 Tax=Magnolia sinica TaxID=86752 RepID=UPI002659FD52|nr:WPP domain-interacting protein 1 [Magnolia sinica]XP_058114535.1 WPP domain-interacting protein 1 [Magnolia sinica]